MHVSIINLRKKVRMKGSRILVGRSSGIEKFKNLSL
jgi:hypothetical protein